MCSTKYVCAYTYVYMYVYTVHMYVHSDQLPIYTHIPRGGSKGGGGVLLQI